MKRFLAKASKTLTQVTAPKSTTSGSSPANQSLLHTGLQPKYTLPPVPHPHPHDHLALLVTKDGLLLRPHIPGQRLSHPIPGPVSHVRIAWGKAIKVEEISGDGEGEGADWGDSVIVYGIVGILELLSGSYLLVITSRSDLGHLFDPTHAVYSVGGVTAIPLDEGRARIALNTISSRNTVVARPSLLPKTTMDTISSPLNPISDSVHSPSDSETDDLDSAAQYVTHPPSSGPHVQFSPDEQIKHITPVASPSFSPNNKERSLFSHSAQSSSSDLSTPSSEFSLTTSPVAKTLASRLSFWSRLSKRTNSLPSSTAVENDLPTVPQPLTLLEEQEELDAIIREGTEEPSVVLGSILAATAPPPVSSEERHNELEDKIVREVIREYTKGGMYFAYNFDITRSLQHKQDQAIKSQKQLVLLHELNALPPEYKTTPNSNPILDKVDKVNVLTEPYATLPLWRRVDRQFWWNEWVAKPFVDAGLHSYVLPIMQGYYQIATFHIPPDPVNHDENAAVDYVMISRRSRDRAGLRYQRRGIDEEAHVANFVETETVMRVEREGISNVFSYVQIRGSVPLFWTQSGYGLKPPPLLAPDRSHGQNLDAIRRHFKRTVPQYGPHAIVNLAEQQGKEAAITQAYREYVRELDSKDAVYNEYDFHTETKGMKYENISKLVDTMERTFESQGYLWISDNTIMSQQKGVFRVNCIDCLDRTNVVQSAFARYVLNKQLGAVALLNPSVEGRTETDLVFNDVWANNGDAISRAYAGTSALKGDFTRTGKRDLTGLLNDGVNSLARMYTSTFSDWFCQAVIDFMLGYRTLSVFSEFLLKLQSTDPRDLIRLSKIRAEAIATSASRVLAEGERLLSGWTLFSPEELNSKIGEKFEEKVLLLTAEALYIISYDYTLEKVKIYTRVPLGDVVSISKGAYILSPLEEASRDPVQNAGFVVSWLNTNQVTRVASYSVRNTMEASSRPPVTPKTINNSISTVTRNSLSTLSRKGTTLSNILSHASLAVSREKAFAAFKVLPIDPARIRRASSGGSSAYAETSDELTGASSCQEAVELMVESIRRACEDIGGAQGEFITDADVVSLAEAQRMTSVYAKMEYGVKRLLWLGG